MKWHICISYGQGHRVKSGVCVCETPMTGFHTWRRRCEGVGQDSGYGPEESHLMHDMKYSI